jgi:hypothetical protein
LLLAKPLRLEATPISGTVDIVSCGKLLHTGVLYKSQNRTNLFEFFDVDKGARVANLTLPATEDRFYLDMDRDGKKAAFWNPMPDSSRKVSIYSLNDGKNIVKDWDPYPAKDKKQGAFEFPALAWVYLLDADRAMTFTRSRKIDFWSMPDMKLLHCIEPMVEDGSADIDYFAQRPRNFAISQDRRLFIRDAGPWGYEFFDTKTQKSIGMTASIREHGAYANKWSIAIRPDGKEMVASFHLRTPKDSSIRWARWSIPSGKLISISTEGSKDWKQTGPMCYWSETHLLVFDSTRVGFSVIDLEKGTRVRTAELATRGHFATSIADDCLFFVTVGDASSLSRVVLPKKGLDGELKQWKIQLDGSVK